MFVSACDQNVAVNVFPVHTREEESFPVLGRARHARHCDCPGLLFAQMVCDGILPID
jgi:hypothetical protein